MNGRRGQRGRLIAGLGLAALVLAGCTTMEAGPPALAVQSRTVAPEDPARFWAEQRERTMDADEKVRTVLMLHYPGTTAEALMPFVEAYRPSGLILMGDNIPADQGQLAGILSQLDDVSDLPLLIGIDQEGGPVSRISDGQPGARELREQDPAVTEAAFRERGAALAGLGIDVNFGIVADVTGDRASFIWSRVLGTDPPSAAQHVAAAVRGEQGAVLSTLKHFPGHGATPADSHVGIPTTAMGLEEWRATQAPPFAAGIDADAELVMTGHLRYSAVDAAPASLSQEWHRILREELGFTGLIVTDDMLMLQNSGEPALSDPLANAIAALNAGSNLLLYVLAADPVVSGVDPATLIEGMRAAAEDGRISPEALDESVLRVLEQRRELAGPSIRQ